MITYLKLTRMPFGALTACLPFGFAQGRLICGARWEIRGPLPYGRGSLGLLGDEKDKEVCTAYPTLILFFLCPHTKNSF